MAGEATTTTTTETTPPPATGEGKGAAGGNGTGATTETGDPEGLGEAGLKALRAERTARERAERERDAAARERDELKSRTQSAEEKALDAARKEGEATANLAANRRIVRSEIKAAAGGVLSDPEDAAALLGDLDRFVVKDEVDTKAIKSAIDELVKSKPYLAPAGKARPLPGGGATQTGGSSFNDELRRRIHRGGG